MSDIQPAWKFISRESGDSNTKKKIPYYGTDASEGKENKSAF